MESVNLGEEFEKHMIMRMNQLTAPQAEWNVGFNDALRHKMQKHKVSPPAYYEMHVWARGNP